MRNFSSLILVFVSLTVTFGEEQRFCSYKDVAASANVMVCKNLMSENDLEEELSSSSKFNMEELIIANSTMRFFKSGSFLHSKFKIISIKNCSLQSLSDTDVAFEGLEDHLQKLFIQNSTMINQFDWRQLRHLKNLTMLVLTNSDVDYVDDSLSTLKSKLNLMAVRLTDNRISWIHPRAFAELKHITSIRLGHNEIENVQRSMFPDPATFISIIDLSYNLLQSIPTDIFTKMPALTMVNLEGNRLYTIEEKTFEHILDNLRILSFLDNPLSCDCRLKWLTKIEYEPQKLRATCAKPQNLKGKSIVELKTKDIWC